MSDAYCENGACRVVLFSTEPRGPERDGEIQNCPGCGRMGRLKDKPKINIDNKEG